MKCSQNNPLRQSLHDLTKGELRILELLAKGYTQTQIKTKLGVCAEAVGNHRRNIKEKLLADDDQHAVRIARDRGLV